MNGFITIVFRSLVVSFLLTVGARAEWYIDADISTDEILPYPSSVSDQSPGISRVGRYGLDRNTPSISLYGGYRAKQNFSLQLEYQDNLSFGIDDIFVGSSLWVPKSASDRFKSNGLFLSGIGSYPISDSGVLYMKGGVFGWEIDSDYYQTSEYYLGHKQGVDLFYGFGGSYDLNTRFGISAEWERYQMKESGTDYLSTKFKFKF